MTIKSTQLAWVLVYCYCCIVIGRDGGGGGVTVLSNEFPNIISEQNKNWQNCNDKQFPIILRDLNKSFSVTGRISRKINQ